MGRKANDLTGQQFGYLTVLERSDYKDNTRHVYWICKCVRCGNITTVRADNLVKEITLSCGCYRPKYHKRWTRKE